MGLFQDSDVDFVDNVVCNLSKSLSTLGLRGLAEERNPQMRHANEMVKAYRELLIATRHGLQSERLTESETATHDRENVLVWCSNIFLALLRFLCTLSECFITHCVADFACFFVTLCYTLGVQNIT